ncbi:MAG TPA: sulfotransferase [Stenomitos sp.]
MSYLGIINKTKIWATPRIQNKLPTWVFPQHEQKFRAYCIGAPKTGTTSIATIFSKNHRSAHEPEASLVLEKILNYLDGKLDQKGLTQYIKNREIRLRLEMDSSHLNYLILDILLNEFEDAKFILTVRDCYSWLNSLLNHHYPFYQRYGKTKRFENSKWTRYYNHIYKANYFKHAPQEEILRTNNLYTLDGYFSYWANHNQDVISQIPADRLIITTTSNIDQSLPRIEEFLGLPQGTLPLNVKENRRDASSQTNILTQINKDFIEEKANLYCKELMSQFFPDIKRIEDSKIGI